MSTIKNILTASLLMFLIFVDENARAVKRLLFPITTSEKVVRISQNEPGKVNFIWLLGFYSSLCSFCSHHLNLHQFSPLASPQLTPLSEIPPSISSVEDLEVGQLTTSAQLVI